MGESKSFVMTQPLQFKPNRVWRTYLGGAVLDRMEGRPEPRDSHTPEDWIASTTRANNPQPTSPDEGLSLCDTDGQSLPFAELLRADPQFYLGKAHMDAHGPELGILVKYLDAAVRLHIQAHPTAEFARARLGSPHGKAEAYYILSVREDCPDPHLLIGFQRPPTRDVLREWILWQDLKSLRAAFDPVPVKPGDCLHIPGGVPHAIGPGICMVELMEPSDWVVRCEFSHAGYELPVASRYIKGDPELSFDCFDLTPRTVEQVRSELFVTARDPIQLQGGGRLETLIDARQTSAFRMQRLTAAGPCSLPGGQPFVGLVVNGSASIGGLQCPKFSRLFFPAGVEAWHVVPDAQGLSLLVCKGSGQ